MLTVRDRFFNTLKEIEYSDYYEEHEELFDKGIALLEQRLRSEDFSEFSEEEGDLLSSIFSYME